MNTGSRRDIEEQLKHVEVYRDMQIYVYIYIYMDIQGSELYMNTSIKKMKQLRTPS